MDPNLPPDYSQRTVEDPTVHSRLIEWGHQKKKNRKILEQYGKLARHEKEM